MYYVLCQKCATLHFRADHPKRIWGCVAELNTNNKEPKQVKAKHEHANQIIAVKAPLEMRGYTPEHCKSWNGIERYYKSYATTLNDSELKEVLETKRKKDKLLQRDVKDLDTINVLKRGSSSDVKTCYLFDYIPDKRYRKYVT